MIPEIKSSMAMKEETEESSYLRLDEDKGDEERRESDDAPQDGYEPDNPRANLHKFGRDRRSPAPEQSFARMRRRSTPKRSHAAPPAVQIRMMMDDDRSAGTI